MHSPGKRRFKASARVSLQTRGVKPQDCQNQAPDELTTRRGEEKFFIKILLNLIISFALEQVPATRLVIKRLREIDRKFLSYRILDIIRCTYRLSLI